MFFKNLNILGTEPWIFSIAGRRAIYVAISPVEGVLGADLCINLLLIQKMTYDIYFFKALQCF